MNTEFDHLLPEAEHRFVSLGFACQLLQCLPGQLKVLMEACDVRFAQVVDGVGYLTVGDGEKLARKCREVREEIESVSTSHLRN